MDPLEAYEEPIQSNIFAVASRPPETTALLLLRFRSVDIVAAGLKNSRVDNACVVTAFDRVKPDILWVCD